MNNTYFCYIVWHCSNIAYGKMEAQIQNNIVCNKCMHERVSKDQSLHSPDTVRQCVPRMLL